jgi:ABC transport system ATP-binding/permease protein
MPTEALASPLTVWIGSAKYTFPPGRDVTVGHDSRADIRVDGVDTSAASHSSRPSPASPSIYLVLHHDGRQWVAVDRSEGGIYVDGMRMSTVFIHDGRVITIGDPQHGLQLLFRLGAPVPLPPRNGPWPGMQPELAPPPAMPAPPRRSPAQFASPPSQSPTQRLRIPQSKPAPVQHPPWPMRSSPPPPPPAAQKPPSQLPTRQFRAAQPQPGATEAPGWSSQPVAPPAHPVPSIGSPQQTAQPWVPPGPPQPSGQPWVPPGTLAEQPPQQQTAWPPAAQRKRRSPVGWLTGAMHTLFSRRPEHQPEYRPESGPPEAASTDPLRRLDATVADAKPARPAAKIGPLKAHQLRLTIGGDQLLGNVSFTAEPGTLTAVVGPTEASTSALVNVLSGVVPPSFGTVTIDGHDVHGENLRSRIGMVPQYDLVDPQLTIDQALGYAAELRLPPRASADHRRRVVNWALNGLQLSSLRTIQVGSLSAEQRKRVSMAVELLTGPALLLLDQPTAGLDTALEGQTATLLRQFADDGRIVVVATTSLTDLDMCDQVLLLTSTGTLAFAGAPADIGDTLGTTSWPEILARVSADPYGAHDAFLARQQDSPPTAPPPEVPVEPLAPTARLSLWRQIVIAARRQAWLVAGDQRYFIFLTILPLLFGALSLLVPGHAGLGPADPYGTNPDEAVQTLAVLNLGAVVMGTALAIRDLRGEQRIFRREQANGLSESAFLAAKIIVYSLVAIVQTGIITTVAVVGKGAPTQGAVLLGNAVVELYLTLAATAIVSAIVALAVSSLTKYIEQTLLAAVLITLIALVFSGGMFPLADRFGLEQISWLVPSRWGFAASASTVDVHAVNLLAVSDNSWTHSPGQWLFDMAMLVVFGAVATVLLWLRLRRPPRDGGHLWRSASPTSAPETSVVWR